MTETLSMASDGWSWLDIVQTTLPPFTALFGAIWVFFVQRKSDREQHLREKRSLIYADYLSVLMDRKAGMTSIPVESFLEYAEKIVKLHSLIVLTAPTDVVYASKVMFGEALVRGMEKANAKRPGLPIDADKSVMEVFAENRSAVDALKEKNLDFATAYQDLVVAMRRDLVSGTQVDNLSVDQVFGKSVLS